MARLVARTFLEVERGHRDVRALRPFLAANLYFGIEQATRVLGAPPVAAADVRAALFERLTATSGYAVTVVREADGSWEALTMVLRRTAAGAWQFVEITRASTHSHGRRQGAQGRSQGAS